MIEQFILELAASPEPSLASFVPGRNQPAVRAVTSLVAGELSPAVLFLWGQPGAGRTHLLRSAVRATIERGGRARLIDASELDEHFVDEPDSLIAMDDLHLLRAGAEQALFETFNARRSTEAPMIFAADRAPAQLALRDDVRTRLGSGITFELTALSDDEKRAALRAHAKARAMPLSEELLSYIFNRADRDMATQLAVLDLLDRCSLSTKRPLTLPLAREVLQRLGPTSARRDS